MAHAALFYGDAAGYVDGVMRFIRRGVARGDPVAVAVPGPRIELLRAHLNGESASVHFLDMFDLGRNPGRIMAAVHDLAGSLGEGPLHYVGEPIWPGRSPEEVREATRHEALINLAFDQAAIEVLCPYDEAALDGAVLDNARRTHPRVVDEAGEHTSPAFTGFAMPPGCDDHLPAPPRDAITVPYDRPDLAATRELVRHEARACGLSEARVADVVIAVNEVATNTVRHAVAPGLLSIWRAPDRLLFEVHDTGCVADPLAGRRKPPNDSDGGRGLWMVHQLCDLVETRFGPHGTTVRLHISLPPEDPARAVS